ncbi:5'-3' exoribonuclease 4 [Tetrabaena socialis]|uniref:5'-3' exoribonuclease 4 n=1 Tax=Tetrabaena socialis TaxID=47790 RepID=A0A2J8AJ33_9CHLO|nr:5'-3' exoribonuclease 4 [Tetrabaena socialis]|eukprot:PNH12529.1 5'-3' exoribonuclease 4 [Tetrabaena socialis]
MGVPHFYKYITTRHKQALRAVLPGPCDALMVDLNCAVHRCAEAVLNAAFMKALCAGLKRSQAALVLLAGCAVHISDSCEPGEGEHKIFSRINSCQQQLERVVVYGADADLIMLSMRSSAKYPFVMREDQVRTELPAESYQFIDIDLLRHRVTHLMGSANEFVVMCMLLGNDFIPPLSFLRVRERGIELLMEKYNHLRRQAIDRGGAFQLLQKDSTTITTTTTTSLDSASLVLLIEAVSANENEAFFYIDAAYTEARKQCSFSGPFSRTPWVRTMEACDTSKILAGGDGWRPRYYTSLFPTSTDMSKLCERYVQGLAWTVAYYFDYEKSKARVSDWYYPYSYSPTSLDLANYLRLLGVDKFKEPEARDHELHHVRINVLNK